MPPEISDEELARLKAAEESAKALQAERDAIKAKNEELLDETKKAKAAKKAAEDEAAAAAKKAAEEAGDFKQLYESSEAARKEAEEKLQAQQRTARESALKSKAAELAAGLTKDTGRAEILADKIRQRLGYSEDGAIRVLDESGGLTVSPVEELVTQIKGRFPFLVDGSQASGGGASGSGGGGATKKFGEMTGAELAELRQKDPQTYQRLRDEHYAQ